jgi:predicted acetyltransferase
METHLIPITKENVHIFDVFVQDYEAEFSAITKKEPNAEGRFALEVDWKKPNSGFYFFVEKKPVGFAIKADVEGRSDIAEFYILPCYRKTGLGKGLAFALFDLFPGPWQVRQIPTAKEAIAFWRTVIHDYTQGRYTEDQIEDLHWGQVIRQLFDSRAPSSLTICVLRGKELLSHLPELAKLRAIIFREYPYLYEVDPTFETSYLHLFANAPNTILVVAKMKDQVIGILSGLPLMYAQKEIQQAFDLSDREMGQHYALCEILVAKEHRSKRIGSLLYNEFESHLKKMNLYKKLVLWQIIKNLHDPKRPSDYFSLDHFWHKNGFIKQPNLHCDLKWKEISQKEETLHRFEFWEKDLKF